VTEKHASICISLLHKCEFESPAAIIMSLAVEQI